MQGLLAGVALATLAGAAAAAETAPDKEPGAQTAPQVSEVLVTAQKRSERLLTVPTPVTAVGAADLSRTQAIRLEDLVSKAPGLNLKSDRAGETVVILRGVTTGSSLSSTVATYIDDTPFGSSTTQALAGWLTPDLDPSDLQRIEVLRGPQGTLYGASSLGGLIKYVTTPPDTQAYGGRLEVDASSVKGGEDGYGVRGMANLPLVANTLGLRISAYSRRDPGFIDNPRFGLTDLNETRMSGGRAALLWKPLDTLSVNLSATLQNLKGKGSSDEDVTITNGSAHPTTGDLQQLRYAAEPLNVASRLYSAAVDDDLGWAHLVSVTSYSTLHQTAVVDQTITSGAALTAGFGIPNFGFSVGSDLRLKKTTQEIRLESPANAHLEWRVGLYYTHEQTVRDEPSSAFSSVTGAPFALPAPVFFATLRSRYTEYAGYGDVTYHFTPRFDLSAGLRYSGNRQSFNSVIGGLASGPTTTAAQTSSDDSTTFLVTPRYKIDEDQMVYARVASGYRPGGPNTPSPAQAAAGVPLAYKPDTLTNYDLGYKAALLDHKLTLDLSAFLIDWKEIQLTTRFGGFTAAGNGGSARSQGFEGSAVWTPVAGLNLSANLAYTDAHLTQSAAGVNGKDGDQLPNVPKWGANLSADYDFPLSGSVSGFVGGGVHYVGDRISGFVGGSPPATFARPKMPAYTTLDLRAGVNWGNYVLQVYAKNVSDERGLENISSEASSAYNPPFTASVIQPRTIGVALIAKW
jgi:iron complex outermembrane receptor protein